MVQKIGVKLSTLESKNLNLILPLSTSVKVKFNVVFKVHSQGIYA